MSKKIIKNKIREFRIKNNMSIDDLLAKLKADKIRTTYITLSDLEGCRCCGTLELRLQICKVFNVEYKNMFWEGN